MALSWQSGGGDSRTAVDWINGRARQKKNTDDVRSAQMQVRDWWSRGVDLRRRVDDCTVASGMAVAVPLDAWAEKRVKRLAG